jgi:hypothetical protein
MRRLDLGIDTSFSELLLNSRTRPQVLQCCRCIYWVSVRLRLQHSRIPDRANTKISPSRIGLSAAAYDVDPNMETFKVHQYERTKNPMPQWYCMIGLIVKVNEQGSRYGG